MRRLRVKHARAGYADAAAFGRVLRQLRVSHGLTQQQLAAKASRDRTFIGILERGEQSPTLTTMLNLCEALGVELVHMCSLVERELGRSTSR